jgi:hypothetical protein
MALDPHDAEIELADYDLIPFAQGSMTYMKKLLEECLEAEIPAVLGQPPGAGKG